MKQIEAFSLVRDKIDKIQAAKSKPVRVAINGIEGTGKTTFAIRFVEYLKAQSCSAFHVSIDGFHFNKNKRYKQGRDSADGYYEDSYNEAAFVDKVLKMSQGDPPRYISATHDLSTDEYLNLKPQSLPDKAVIVTDGCYLFKPIFNPFWDLRIYLKTDFNTALERGAQRDRHVLGGYDEAKKKFGLRYHAASKRYLSEVSPEALADIIIDNTDFEDLKFG